MTNRLKYIPNTVAPLDPVQGFVGYKAHQIVHLWKRQWIFPHHQFRIKDDACSLPLGHAGIFDAADILAEMTGHRRFALEDIESYLARQRVDTTSQLPATWADMALIQTRQQVAHHGEHRWLKQVDEEHLRDEYRQLGHQLMGLLLQYVATEDPNGTFIEEAQRIGRLYGAYGIRAGLTLTSILEATLFFRDILIESSLKIPTTTYVEPDASLRILRRVNQIVNSVQLAVTNYYETSGGS